MRKLVRTLMLLSAIGLTLVATPNRPARAQELAVIGPGSGCTAAENNVTLATFSAAVVCSWTSGSACQTARDAVFTAQLKMIAACYAV